MPKESKKRPSERESAFRLHYFPEIPVEFSAGNRSQTKDKSAFHRIDFGKPNEALSGLVDEALEENRKDSSANHREIQEIEAQAFLRGFNKGEKAGFKTGQDKIEALLKNLKHVIAELTILRKQIFIDSEKEIVELALAIARRIICHEVQLNKNTVIDVTREALKRVEDHENIKIRMGPEDFECFESAADPDLICNNDNVTFEAQEAISSGGCIIETEAGTIDARIEKQLQAVEGALRAAYKRYQS